MQGSLRSEQAAVGAGERLSAAMDGEWSSVAGRDDAALGTLLSGLSQQDRQTWSLYHLVGDALRSEELAATPATNSRFVDRFAAKLAAEPAFVAPVLARQREQKAARGMAGWTMGRRLVTVPSFAAAAAVATLAWVLVPALHPGSGGLGGSGSTAPVAQVATLSADGEVQPSSRDGWQRVNLGSDHRLDPYLEAHQQFASDRSSLGYAAAYAGLANDRR